MPYICTQISTHMNVLNYTEFRNKMKPALDSVVEDGETLIINRGENNNAVVISLDEYNAMNETLHILSSPKNAQRLLDAIEREKKGDYQFHELIEE